MDIGSRIKSLRTEQGMSQEQLANQLHVTRQTVSNWENNKNYPDFGTMVEISDLFSVSLDTLIKGDSGYINKQSSVERKSVTRRRWIIVLLLVMVIITGIFCKYIYELGQGTEDTNRITTFTDIMMSVNLPGQTPSQAISKTYDAIDFDGLGEEGQQEVLESVCGKIEGDIPSVYVDRRSSGEIELHFRHTEYYDIDPVVTSVDLYTTYGMPADPQKRTDKTVDYTVENGKVHFNVCDFIKQKELVFDQELGDIPEEKMIMDCIFVVRYSLGWQDYVSVTAVGVLPDGNMETALAKDIMLEYYSESEEININDVNIIAMESLDRYQAVAFAYEDNRRGLQILREEQGEYVPYLVDYEIPANENFYNTSFCDIDNGKYYVVAFYKEEVKDLSVEFDWENDDLQNTQYVYNFSHDQLAGPAIYIVGETIKDWNFSVNITAD